MTRGRELWVRETMEQYLAKWKLYDDHVAETCIVGDLELWHFYNQYMDWYHGFTRCWISRRSDVHESVVSIRQLFICRVSGTSRTFG
ncbi:hypothetical protein LINGRAHAP2_LOCUS7316 [Linum grandiflorum]